MDTVQKTTRELQKGYVDFVKIVKIPDFIEPVRLAFTFTDTKWSVTLSRSDEKVEWAWENQFELVLILI